MDLSAVDKGAAVEEIPADAHGHAEHEHGPERRRGLGEALELAQLRGDEASPLNEVLHRVAADDLLREHSDRRVLPAHGLSYSEAPIDVRAHGADRGVDAGDSDLDEPHGRGAYPIRDTLAFG